MSVQSPAEIHPHVGECHRFLTWLKKSFYGGPRGQIPVGMHRLYDSKDVVVDQHQSCESLVVS
jgi:hypothetical protein